jgi:hypothetical protein
MNFSNGPRNSRSSFIQWERNNRHNSALHSILIEFSLQGACSVRTPTRLRAGRPGTRKGLPVFITASRPALWSIQWSTLALSVRVNQPRREAEHSMPSSAEVKTVWSYTSPCPYVFMAWYFVKLRGTVTLLDFRAHNLMVPYWIKRRQHYADNSVSRRCQRAIQSIICQFFHFCSSF